MDFDECIRKGFIKIAPADKNEIEKEIASAKDDIAISDTSLEQGQYKWSIIQSYYSMFHAARALLYSRGYKERSHACIELFLEHIVKNNELDQNYLADFKAARYLREEANYQSTYSEERARAVNDSAEIFLNNIQSML